jgi:peptidoglycan hydrolase-like protein with peptidoglycan-binding domain
MGHHATTFFTAMLISGASLGLAGCNTAEGFGDDVSAGWHWITGSSSSNTASSTGTSSNTAASGSQTASSGSSQHTASAPPATHKPHAMSGSSEPPGMSRDKIKQAQTKLHDNGFYSGPIDGVIGPETRSAVMAFQTKAGIPPNGELNAETVSSLNANKM